MARARRVKARLDNGANKPPHWQHGNALEREPDDWWDELCMKHETENHWKKEEKKKNKKK
jgi:hypothetical protein